MQTFTFFLDYVLEDHMHKVVAKFTFTIYYFSVNSKCLLKVVFSQSFVLNVYM
jgi:hypothetical protein